MLKTYNAVLRGNALEWREERPAQLTSDQAVNVHVTLLEDMIVGSGERIAENERGAHMAAALEAIARLRSATLPEDPAQWEREQRQDRPLPGRDADAY